MRVIRRVYLLAFYIGSQAGNALTSLLLVIEDGGFASMVLVLLVNDWPGGGMSV